jgi:hypothetical protein
MSKKKPTNKKPRGAPRRVKDGRSTTVYLPAADLATLDAMGCANRSQAISEALRRLRASTQKHPLMHCQQCGALKGHDHTCTP